MIYLVTHVKKLNISFCIEIESIEGLEQVTELNISTCRYSLLHQVSSLKNLKKLTVSNDLYEIFIDDDESLYVNQNLLITVDSSSSIDAY